MSRKSRRLPPARKQAREQLRGHLHVLKGQPRAWALRSFIKGNATRLLNEFPLEAPGPNDVEHVLALTDEPFLEAFGLKLAELLNTLRADSVKGHIVH